MRKWRLAPRLVPDSGVGARPVNSSSAGMNPDLGRYLTVAAKGRGLSAND
jgi:hypothetical protein